MNKLNIGNVFFVMFIVVAVLSGECWCETRRCLSGCQSVNLQCPEDTVLTDIKVLAACKCSNCSTDVTFISKDIASCEGQQKCTIRKSVTSGILENCPRQNQPLGNFQADYTCANKDKPDASEQSDNGGNGSKRPRASLELIVALAVSGLVIVILLIIIGIFTYRRRTRDTTLVEKKLSVIGTLRRQISNQPPSRDNSIYRKLPDSLSRQSSTYNSIPFDTDQSYPYAVDKEIGCQIAEDRQADGSQIQNGGYNTRKSDEPPVLPDRPNSQDSDYNVVDETNNIRQGDNAYSHCQSDSDEYDRIVRHPYPKVDENYSHFKCDANEAGSKGNGATEDGQTTDDGQENHLPEAQLNGFFTDSGSVKLPIAVSVNDDSSDQEDETLEEKQTNNNIEDWDEECVPGTAQDDVGEDVSDTHRNTENYQDEKLSPSEDVIESYTDTGYG